jgi:hypothetical protein
MTQTLAQLRRYVALCARDINAPRRSVDESGSELISSEQAVRRFEALLRQLHTATQSEQAVLWRYRSWLVVQAAMAYNAARRTCISQVKADQKARGRYLGGIVPFGFRRGESGELVPHEGEQQAIREMAALRAEGRPLRAIAEALRAKGFRISHEGVKGVLKAQEA